MVVNCRPRLEPRLDTFYFGNVIQSILIIAPAGELLSWDLSWGADLLHKANKFDGKISAFLGRERNEAVNVEVVLASETMTKLENDVEFMQYFPGKEAWYHLLVVGEQDWCSFLLGI
ncbi:hypothetical protein SLEP1_g26946 [Rubroshorea leprosula]|uniref:Uncharacterized protein n=1 Tax=Rubroshorea leprosula TaxID=152421 RepID=A0AAV5JNY3_9ROSI|nr:hypothetical protein SLEP1_g26946 [Rubroshorea leprosula]